MDSYKRIEEALERLIRWDTHKEFYSVIVSFKIEILDECQDKTKFPTPQMRVHAIKNENNEIIDFRLSLGLFFDGEDESKSKVIYDEIMNSKLSFLFGIGPVSQYNLSASLGKDVKMASSIILYFISLFSKSKEIEIIPLYYCPMVLKGEMSNLEKKVEILPSQAIKNLMDALFDRTRTNGASLLFDVLKDNRDNSEFLAEVSINKWHDGEGYTAWLRTGEISVQFLDAMFQRFVDYPNKYCAREFNIQDNALDVRVEFYEDQINEIIYFISDCLLMFYPSLTEDKIIAQAKFINSLTTIQFYLVFYPDGTRPSDKELEYVFQLRDNPEHDVDEDEYFDPEIE